MLSQAPGRTELAGNHTDHQGGRVIAATLDCGVRMELRAADSNRAQLVSKGFEPVDISLDDTAPVAAEFLTTASLVRGVVAGMRAAGVAVSGFSAQVESTVPAGGGLSSSAAFELALAAGLNLLFSGALSPYDLAFIGQAAERDWFGKPCGLMDQLSIALGGTNLFDFAVGGATLSRSENASPESAIATSRSATSPAARALHSSPKNEEESVQRVAQALSADRADDSRQAGVSGGLPLVEHIPFDLQEYGYALCLVDTRCDHSAYTDEYASVAADMTDVAHFLGADVLSQVSQQQLFDRFGDVRAALGDLPALRALHYFIEMRLVDERARALHAGDFGAFLAATRQSGASSAQFLQNVSTFDRREQPAMVALALATTLLAGRGAARIHGGGFGGSIQAFVPLACVDEFTQGMDAHLGAGACRVYATSGEGARATWM